MPEGFDPLKQPESKEKLKKRILLADDEEMVIIGTETMLNILGYEVVIVRNGKELLDKIFSGERFDVVITDNNMPEMNGIDALEQVRKNPEFERLPLILNSAKEDSSLKERVEKLGVKYLKKPYDGDTLESVLNEIFKDNSK